MSNSCFVPCQSRYFIDLGWGINSNCAYIEYRVGGGKGRIVYRDGSALEDFLEGTSETAGEISSWREITQAEAFSRLI
jgi:hypothetical protein